jgi:hypothetical protein
MKRESSNKLKTDILFVDTWRFGIKLHYLPLFKYLREWCPNISMRALHRESLYSRHNSIAEVDIIEGLECYDVSYFPWQRDLERIIQEFHPRIIMILTHSFLFDRSIIKLCRRIGIRTIFLQHGAVRFSLQKPKLKLYLLPAVYLDKARRYLLYYLPVYFRVAAPEDPLCMLRPSFLRFLLGSLFLNYWSIPPKATSEIRADQALVYGEFYAKAFKRLHGYRDDQVHVVGNPTFDLLVDLANQDEIGRRNNWLEDRGLNPNRKTVTYIAQPLVEDRFVRKSDFETHLSLLLDQVAGEGMNLVIKLHPRNAGEFLSMGRKQGVYIERTELTESVYYADVVLGHFSTALGLAIAAVKPLVLWNPFKVTSTLVAGGFQQLIAIAHVANTPGELKGVLSLVRNDGWLPDQRRYQSWLREYSYFDRTEKAVQRIAQRLITEYRSSTGNIEEERSRSRKTIHYLFQKDLG